MKQRTEHRKKLRLARKMAEGQPKIKGKGVFESAPWEKRKLERATHK